MSVENFSINAGAHFAGGFVFGMTGENHLEELTSCYKGGDLLYKEIDFAIGRIESDGWDNITQGALALAIAALQIPQDLHTCENMDEDIAAITEWVSIFKDPTALIADVTKHLALHRKVIKSDIALVKSDWAAAEYWAAGIAAADLATMAIGPIKPVYPSMIEAEVGLSAMAVPDFVAGLIYGFTGDNQLTEIEDCWNGGNQVVTDAEALVHDLANLNFIRAEIDNAHLVDDIQDSMTKCTGMDDDFARIAAWGQIFTEPTKLAETVAKNWLLHKRGIKKDIAKEQADWANGDYFSAGTDIADALTKLIGDVE